MVSPIAFILGAGPGVGRAVALKLKENGYKVAVGSRKPDFEDAKNNGLFPVTVDAANAVTITEAFQIVEKELGGSANVVIYNAASSPSLPKPGQPLSLPLSEFEDAVAVGSGVFVAAQHALTGFRAQSSNGLAKVFITTGNIFPFRPASVMFAALGAQKKVSAHIMELCAGAYSKEGFRFYFASQVNSAGKPPGGEFSPEPHAIAYWNIIQTKEQAKWDYRFTKDGSILPDY